MLGETQSNDPKKGVEVASLASVYAYPVGLRTWGLRISTADTGSTYVLTKGLVDTDKSNNNNWSVESLLASSDGFTQIEVTDIMKGHRIFFGDSFESIVVKGVLDGNQNQGIISTSQLLDTDDVPNNSCLDVTAYCTGIKTNGTASFSARRRAIFRKDNAGVLTMDVSAATELLESVVGTVVAWTLLINSGSIAVTLQTGAAVGTHRCESWAEVKITKIPT